MRFDSQLVLQIVQRILIPGIKEAHGVLEKVQASVQTLDSLNSFIFENLRRPSKKQPQMSQNVASFYTTHRQDVFAEVLKTIAYALLFEEHPNVWVF